MAGKGDRDQLVREMLEIAEAEIKNAEGAIPLVEFDSRLGYEPSMDYMCDRAHLEWKIEVTRKAMAELTGPFKEARKSGRNPWDPA